MTSKTVNREATETPMGDPRAEDPSAMPKEEPVTANPATPTQDDVCVAEISARRALRADAGGLRFIAFVVVPVLVMVLALLAGYLKFQDGTMRNEQQARSDSVAAAASGAAAMLSYRADTAERDLTAAATRMTGTFRDTYTKLIREVVIPGATQKSISVTATVAAAAPVSATATHAVVLLFIDQTLLQGTDPPTQTSSSVRVTLDKQRDQWLISQFDPV